MVREPNINREWKWMLFKEEIVPNDSRAKVNIKITCLHLDCLASRKWKWMIVEEKLLIKSHRQMKWKLHSSCLFWRTREPETSRKWKWMKVIPRPKKSESEYCIRFSSDRFILEGCVSVANRVQLYFKTSDVIDEDLKVGFFAT